MLLTACQRFKSKWKSYADLSEHNKNPDNNCHVSFEIIIQLVYELAINKYIRNYIKKRINYSIFHIQ
jgi:hypothetical protein